METTYGDSAQVMSMKDWVITMLITAIPMVGFIMLLVWSFSDSVNPNKRNWARATLIFLVVGVVLYIIIMMLFVGAMFSSGGFDSL